MNRERVMRKGLLIVSLLFVVAESLGAQKLASLTEDLRLDATKEDFPRVSAVAVGPKEQIVVLVPSEMQFRVYDSSGKKLGTFGRLGSGPGEFRSPTTPGWVGDTIWIYDVQLRRVSWFGPDLKLLRTELLPQPKMAGAVTPAGNRFGVHFIPFILKADGSMIGDGTVSHSVAVGEPWERFIGVQAPSGDITKLPFSPNFEDSKQQLFYAGFYRTVPFMIWPSIGVTPTGSRIGLMTVSNSRPDGGEISVTTWSLANWSKARDSDGRLKVEFSKTIPFKGVAIPSRVRDSVLAAFIPAGGRPSEGPAELPQRFQAMARERMPSFYNPVESLILGLDQTVWLLRPTRNDQWSADVYDGKGNLLGRVEPARKTRIRFGTATHIWTTQRDEDDLISIVRYRITWPK
jgi:hypothetical protein